MNKRLTAVGAASLLTLSIPARATTVTFDDLGVARGTTLPSPTAIDSFGFHFTFGPLFLASGFKFLVLDNGVVGADAGTTDLLQHYDVVMTKAGGGTFSLQRFDFAGFMIPGGEIGEGPFSVVGNLIGGGSVVANFTPDGVVDNTGPLVDYETFVLGPDWSNLTDVTWTQLGSAHSQGVFNLDNITVDEPSAPVPEPASLLLVGSGLAFIARLWQKRLRNAKR